MIPSPGSISWRVAAGCGRRPAVFLDKDGTLADDVPYNVDPLKLSLKPGAVEALRRLRAHGFDLIVVSNQSGIARGHFSEEELRRLANELRSRLWSAGVPLAAFYYCPHHPDGCVAPYAVRCDCRKPAPGLLQEAAARQQLDLVRSWMVGDILDDVEAGRRAGCRTVLVESGGETEWVFGPLRRPDAVATGLLEASEVIVRSVTPSAARVEAA